MFRQGGVTTAIECHSSETNECYPNAQCTNTEGSAVISWDIQETERLAQVAQSEVYILVWHSLQGSIKPWAL